MDEGRLGLICGICGICCLDRGPLPKSVQVRPGPPAQSLLRQVAPGNAQRRCPRPASGASSGVPMWVCPFDLMRDLFWWFLRETKRKPKLILGVPLKKDTRVVQNIHTFTWADSWKSNACARSAPLARTGPKNATRHVSNQNCLFPQDMRKERSSCAFAGHRQSVVFFFDTGHTPRMDRAAAAA